MSTDKPGILVLCTGNSCRSQMAAAYLDRLAGDRLQVFSAGTEPAEDIHPLTRVVLAEDGVSLPFTTPTDYREYLGHLPVYYLLIVCDGAAKRCPSVWPGVMERLHWPFEDPALVEGSHDQKIEAFRRVRDQIRRRVQAWVEALNAVRTT